MVDLILKISDGQYDYGKFKLQKHRVEENGDGNALSRPSNINKRVRLDSAFVHYLVKELKISQFYRVNFIDKWSKGLDEHLTLILQPTKYDLIDYEWNDRVFVMVREKCELEHALSWLSTLGGAFSALGDYFPNCAETAGKISIHQLKLALRLRDPSIAARCRLYLSLSLIQKRKFRLARRIILGEYRSAKQEKVSDARLMNMCHGIWSKLQYEHAIFRKGNLCRRMHKVGI